MRPTSRHRRRRNRRRASAARELGARQLTGEIGVVGGSVPGVEGEGTSMSGPGEGNPGGAGLGWPG
jgi:hypothetical protein